MNKVIFMKTTRSQCELGALPRRLKQYNPKPGTRVHCWRTQQRVQRLGNKQRGLAQQKRNEQKRT